MVRQRVSRLFRGFTPVVIIVCLVAAIFSLLGFLSGTPVQAADGPEAAVEWSKTFGGTKNDHFYGVQQTSDGGYIMVGYRDSNTGADMDVWLVKTDANGNEVWSRTYVTIDDERAFSVQQTSDGGYIVGGSVYSYSEADIDMWLLKVDASGNEQWNRTFGGAMEDWGYYAQQTSDGGYIIVGSTHSYAWLVKTDSNGNEQWNKTLGGRYGMCVRLTSDGGYIIVGGATNSGTNDFWLVKVDSSGNQVWDKTFGGAGEDYANHVQQTADGGYFIVGYTFSYGAGGVDIWIMKTDSSGNMVWDRTFGGEGTDWGFTGQQTSDGGFVLVGIYDQGAGNRAAWLIKTDSNGVEEWNKFLATSGDNQAHDVEQTSDGGYAVVGDSQYGGQIDAWIMKISNPSTQPANVAPIDGASGVSVTPTLTSSSFSDPDGGDTHAASQWQVRTAAGSYSSPIFDSGTDGANLTSITLSAGILDGNTTYYWHVRHQDNHGSWSGYSTETSFTTQDAPINPADGPEPAIEWSRTFIGGTGNDYYRKVQQTSDGGYIVVGNTDSYGAGASDVWLTKTDSDGNETWSRTYGGVNGENGWSVQQTPDGGYIIGGTTSSYGAGSVDMWLLKVDSNGNEQWNRTFGGAGGDALGYAQQTSDGGYIVVGYTDSYGAGGADIWLVKTDSNGNEQWNKTFGGTDHEYGYCVQQTSDGGYVIVGIESSSGAGGYDVWIIKTDSSGDQVWDNTFGGTSGDYGNYVQQTSDGGYVIAGRTQSYGAGDNDIWLIKVDSSGSKVWDRTFGGTGSDMAFCVQQTSDGGYVVVGHYNLGGGKIPAWLAKIDSNGVEEWSKFLAISGSDWAEAEGIEQTSDGGYVVVGYAGGLDAWIMKISNPSNQATNMAPIDGASGVSVTPTLTSSSFSDPDSGDTHAASQWQINTISGDYSSPIYDGGTDASHLTSITLSSGILNGNTTYYWRVRHQDNHGAWSGYSAETSFTTLNEPPDQPTNTAPSNGATNVSLTPTLQSSAFSDPDAGDSHAASQWQISTTLGDYSSPVFDSGIDASNLTSIAIHSGILDFSTTYYWHVMHQDNRGEWSDWSSETSFSTQAAPNNPPTQPGNVSPSNGATGVSLTPTLQSSAFSDPDAGDSHAASQWQIRTGTGSYGSPVYDSGTDASHLISVTTTSLSYSTTYYWHVRYQDSHGDWSTYSAETSFTTLAAPNNPPSQPSNVSPSNGASGISLTPTLQSSAFSDPDTGDTHAASQWQIRTSSGSYGSPVYDSGTDASHLISIGVPSLNYSTTYYWHVRYQDNHGAWSSYSAERSFTTISAPPSNNTPVGSPVTVPLNGTVVTFDDVTVAGNTTHTSQQGNPGGGIPEGFMLRGQFVDVVTTATYSGPITIGIRYDPSIPNPQNLKLFHWYGGHWDDVTTSVDTTNHIVYGQVNSLSWFFIGGEWVWVDDGAHSAPVFPNLYIGIGAALGAGIVAYAVRRRLATK